MYLDNNDIISRLLLYSPVAQSGLGPRTGGDPSDATKDNPDSIPHPFRTLPSNVTLTGGNCVAWPRAAFVLVKLTYVAHIKETTM
jgi:hypothetical protein